MPSSDFATLPPVMRLILGSSKNTILDIGPGFGKFGVLCREYADIWQIRYDKESWKTKIDCIEVFENYITPLHKYIYDNIYVGKAEELIHQLDNYDLILVLDVIEHMDKEVGIQFLKNCKEKAKTIIVSTPNGHSSQGVVFGNEYEVHRCGWSIPELESLGFKCESVQLKIVAHWKNKEQ